METTVTPASIRKETFGVNGMTCASCAVSLQTYLGSREGVEEVNVSYPNQSIQVAYDPGQISAEQLDRLAKEIGYGLITGDTEARQQEIEKSEGSRLMLLKRKLWVSIALSLPVFILSMFLMGVVPYENWIMLALSTPVLFWSGSEFFINGFKRIRHFTANMDTLVALSTGIAWLFSLLNTLYPQYLESQGLEPHVYYESAVIIITLILLGRYLEERAKGKTSSAIKKLMGLRPDTVTAIRNGEEATLSVSEVMVGDILVIRPGEKIPVDGKVRRGDTYIDESMITGEPMPLHKTKRDKVYAGTLNQSGNFQMLAEKIGADTLLAQIIRLVQDAQSSKPPVQKLVDRIAGVFVPVVIVISLIAAATWFFIGPEPKLTYSFLILITVLIIACPCALGLATPTALMVGIGRGAESGILIRDARSLEHARKADTLVLDKTGTLTRGKPRVTDIRWFREHPSYPSVLAGLEKASEHPLSRAVTLYFSDQVEKPANPDQFESLTGKGIRGVVDNHHYFVGNGKILDNHDIQVGNDVRVLWNEWESNGATVIAFADEQGVIALLAISDPLKENVPGVIRQLREKGLTIVMLTGDNEKAAAHVAGMAGIEHFRAGLLPADKGDYIQSLQEKGKVVAMAGDGINDSQALALADVSIAMGSGSDIAMESADITLMHSDLDSVNKAINLSKQTIRTIRQNLFWAFFYNIIAIPVAAGALYPVWGFLLNPMIAGAAMAFSSVSVVTNSLRLRKKKIID